MIQLDFQIDPSWQSSISAISAAEADEAALRYRLVLGDVIFHADSVDFSAQWGWIPLLDFAWSLEEIANQLRAGSMRQEFEFTESDARINFISQPDGISISASFVEGTALVGIEELRDAANDFLIRVMRAAVDSNREFLRNPVFVKYLKQRPIE
ncbi:MAG: hypothetical protein K1X53_08360 [Candidatus Sumerlaeaceae bacterium]|nr:hypothetical protein [Candidatus Sumerlaeaceae bacterium]